MKKILVIPHREHLDSFMKLSEEYQLGFEYNDFFHPAVLEDEAGLQQIIREYHTYRLPEYTTLHGAFYDIIPTSADTQIRRIADLRIEQSIRAAKSIGARAVIFHTNYNPFLNTETYSREWIQTNIRYWSRMLERYEDIHIYLENMFDTTPDMLEQLSEGLGRYDNYGVCLDYAHAALSKTEPELWAKQLGSFVKHIHLNDNDRVSDLHLAWGEGKIDRGKFYEAYDKYMKDATVLIETNSMERQMRSLALLKQERFLEQ